MAVRPRLSHVAALLAAGYSVTAILTVIMTMRIPDANRGAVQNAPIAPPPMEKAVRKLVGNAPSLRAGSPKRPRPKDSSAAAATVETTAPTVPDRSPTTKRGAGGRGTGGRFPRRGTAEFSRRCGWTERRAGPSPPAGAGAPDTPDCTVLARPKDKDNEGVSAWASQIVSAHIVAAQVGCRLLLDYGGGVDVRRVLAPPATDPSSPGGDDRFRNWTVPRGFECKPQWRYFCNANRNDFEIPGKEPYFAPPAYRFAYFGSPQFWIYRGGNRGLESALPGFEVESGFACAMGDAVELAPTASEFEPRLFTEILPALNEEGSLVMAIYLRTGRTDDIAKDEEKGTNTTIRDFRKSAAQMLKCAMTLEERYLSGEAGPSFTGIPFKPVVWMILTDSPDLKQWAVDSYSGRKNAGKLPQPIERKVLVTGSRGVHTRTRRGPSTADFAEAVIDWFLIGESDLVLANRLTFGYTGALRTARPIYDPSSCKQSVLVHERDNETLSSQ